MKYFKVFMELIAAVLLSVSLGGIRCPLFTKDEILVEENAVKTKAIGLEVWQSKRANGLQLYHFKGDKIYQEIWAKDRDTAIRKFLSMKNIFSVTKQPGLAKLANSRSVFYRAEIIA